MAIHIQSGKNNSSTVQPNIQYVPFKIHADCDTKVSKYFEPYVKTGTEGVLKASFRGYPLKGKKIELPGGYTGVVLHESMRPITEKDERKFYMIHRFNSLMYWNWDKMPSKNDTFMQALDWIDIAEALHTPVVEE